MLPSDMNWQMNRNAQVRLFPGGCQSVVSVKGCCKFLPLGIATSLALLKQPCAFTFCLFCSSNSAQCL